MRLIVFGILTCAFAASVAFAQTSSLLDFSTEADETGDVFASSVEARYPSSLPARVALADLQANGMICSTERLACSREAVATDRCTYRFTATLSGPAESVRVSGSTEIRCVRD